jgi:hypothetical protein
MWRHWYFLVSIVLFIVFPPLGEKVCKVFQTKDLRPD